MGHLKAEHRMGRNYLWHRVREASNAVLAAVDYNFRTHQMAEPFDPSSASNLFRMPNDKLTWINEIPGYGGVIYRLQESNPRSLALKKPGKSFLQGGPN